LPGAELVPFCSVRPSANAAGDANRNSAAAAPAALEERELRTSEEEQRRFFFGECLVRATCFHDFVVRATRTSSETTREDARDRRGVRYARYRYASMRDASARERRARFVVVVSAP
jgi:hypothetical protein